MESIEAIFAHNERVCREAEMQKRQQAKRLPVYRRQHVAAEFGHDYHDDPPRLHCSIRTCASSRPALLYKEDIKPLFEFLRKTWPEAFGCTACTRLLDDEAVKEEILRRCIEWLKATGRFETIERADIREWTTDQQLGATYWADHILNHPGSNPPTTPEHVRELLEEKA